MRKTRSQFILSIIVTILSIILAFNTIMPMVLSSLGKTPESRGWYYVVVLYIFLGMIGLLKAIASITRKSSLMRRNLNQITVILSFALLGFYYGGINTDNNPQIAITSAIALGIIGGIISWQGNQLLAIVMAPIAIVAAYGFAFYTGLQAIELYTVSQLRQSIFWAGISLLYIGLTLMHLYSFKREATGFILAYLNNNNKYQ